MISNHARCRSWRLTVLLTASLGLLVPAALSAQPVTRVVVLKSDGLPHDVVERTVRERNPRTGKSELPWIEHVFFDGGTTLANFYVRGMSLSGPSWSMLDTGQHLQIKGNVEFDRYTQHPYDYLNFFPFWLDNARSRQVDMWGTSRLDDLGIPLLLDAYAPEERYQSFQLFQRGTRWTTLQEGLRNRVSSRRPRQLLDDWVLGIDTRGILAEQLERELIAKLSDPSVRYLDYYTTDFDHDAHHNKDRATHLVSLRELDALVGRVWTAIQRTPEAANTILVLLSDHGVNTDETVYSQGDNLVNLLASASGGGHHVVTKRRLLKDYSIKGIYPLVPLITTSSDDSPYLKGQSGKYPTALVDFDGNERVSIHLRDSTLNTLHILWTQVRRRQLPAAIRKAAAEGFVSIVDRYRETWQLTISELREEIGALARATAAARLRVPPVPDDDEEIKETVAERQERIRQTARIDMWTREESEYLAYVRTLERLLAVTPATLADSSIRIEDVIAPGAMGDRNSLRALQRYVVGLSPAGLTLTADGRLDFERSFARVDYFDLLANRVVRNNVQPGVSNRPVSFTALRLPCRAIDGAAGVTQGVETCIWLNSGGGAEALILARHDVTGTLQLRYLPVSDVREDEDGTIRFLRTPWRNGLPLELWEDAGLALPSGASRAHWFDQWHSDVEWLHAVHRTHYSNAIVGLHEQLAPHEYASLDPSRPGLSPDERLLRRFRTRQREIVEPDILVHASDHWNFDVRGFNPGGNHGSFYRPSTHATFMVAGGERTGVQQGLKVEEPYDSLSVMPTLLRLTGRIDEHGRPDDELRARGFEMFPGRLVRELLGGVEAGELAVTGERR